MCRRLLEVLAQLVFSAFVPCPHAWGPHGTACAPGASLCLPPVRSCSGAIGLALLHTFFLWAALSPRLHSGAPSASEAPDLLGVCPCWGSWPLAHCPSPVSPCQQRSCHAHCLLYKERLAVVRWTQKSGLESSTERRTSISS